MKRREFFLAAAGVAVGPRVVAGAGIERLGVIGVQLFSLPKMLERDFEGALAMLAELGYREVELFGPYPFSPPEAQARWKALGPQLGFSGSGYFGRTPREVRALLDRHGLSAPSIHIELDALEAGLGPIGEAAAILGHRYVGISNIPGPRRRTLDDYKRMADTFNTLGHQAAPLGFKILYHNHGYGLAPMEGKIPLHELLDRLDPSVVALEMDLFWTVSGGADPVEMLRRWPKLYRLMHVKDMSQRARFAGDGGDASQWMALFPLMTTAGNGVLDLPRILGEARRAGVQHFLVEQDNAADPRAQLGASIRYLRGLDLPR